MRVGTIAGGITGLQDCDFNLDLLGFDIDELAGLIPEIEKRLQTVKRMKCQSRQLTQ